MRQLEGQPQKSGFKDFVSNRAKSLRKQLEDLTRSGNPNRLRPAMAGGVNIGLPEMETNDLTKLTKESPYSKTITYPDRKQNLESTDEAILTPTQPNTQTQKADTVVSKEEAERIRKIHEKDQAPTQEEADEANEGRIKPNKLMEFISKHKLATASVGILGTAAGTGAIAVGVNAALNTRVEAHQSITTPEGPYTFDDKADEITVGPNNIVAVDQATLDTLPSFDANGKPIFLFDLKLPQGTEVNATKSLTSAFIPKDVMKSASAEGVRNSLITPEVPIGSEELAPFDGRAFIVAFDKVTGGLSADGKTNLTPPVGIKVEFMGPNNILYFYNIAIEGITPSEVAGILNINIDAPVISKENSNARDWEKGLLVKKGALLFTNNKVVTLSRYIEGGNNGILATNDRVPGNLQYHVDSSNKLITLRDGATDYGNGVIGPSTEDQKAANSLK